MQIYFIMIDYCAVIKRNLIDSPALSDLEEYGKCGPSGRGGLAADLGFPPARE